MSTRASRFVFRPRGTSPARGLGAVRGSRSGSTLRFTPYECSGGQHSGNSSSDSESSRSGSVPPAEDTQAFLIKECYRLLIQTNSSLEKLSSDVLNIQKQIQEHQTSQFTLKSGNLEKPLRSAVAEVYCCSLKREMSEQETLDIVVNVLGTQAQEKYKSDIAVKACRSLMATFRGEERRRVYGFSPCEKAKMKSTDLLASELMLYYKAKSSIKNQYVINLAVLRLYIRLNPDASFTKNFFQGFRAWLIETYPDTNGVPNPAELDDIKKRDTNHDYVLYPVGLSDEELEEFHTDAIPDEVNVDTDSAERDS